MTREHWAKIVALYDSFVTSVTGQAPTPLSEVLEHRPEFAPKAPESPSTPRPQPRPFNPRPPLEDGESPYSADVERALLGTLLLDNGDIAEAVQQLVAEDFFLSSHQQIFRSIVALAGRGQPLDLITLSDELKRASQFDSVGGVMYLVSLTDGLVLRKSIAPYMRILRQKSGLRYLLRSTQEVMRCASLPDATLEECKARWSALFDDRRLQLTSRLRTCAAGELLRLELPARGMILGPVIPTQGLTMLYSPRGVGKTYLALGMAWAVATGSPFLRWLAPQPRKVLFVDGELPATTLQERLSAIQRGFSSSANAEEQHESEHNLRLITPDLQEFGVPDISTRTGQALIENELDGADLLVLDNLSALIRSGNENEGESWLPVADWALRLRQRGVSVLFLHHAGKSGAQRGTSRREDLLDTVIALKRPPDYCASQGLRCEVRFEKARGFHGDDAKPFEASIKYGENGAIDWATAEPQSSDDTLLSAAARLFQQGRSVREVAQELDISPTAAHRRLQWLRNNPVATAIPTADSQLSLAD